MTKTRRVLVTNDDGVRAPGLAALAAAARTLGEVVVVAPDREQSGASHALTLRRPLRVEQLDDACYSVEGTPTDCVNLAFFQLLDRPPDLVLSGVNAGYNLGDDVTYSGTVAGAMEGLILGAPSLAVSTFPEADVDDYARASAIAADLAAMMLESAMGGESFLNVNVPKGASDWRLTHQGRRGFREGPVSRRDPNGRDYYWIGVAPEEWRPDEEADHAAVRDGVISVTPLHLDLTDRVALKRLRGAGWLGVGRRS